MIFLLKYWQPIAASVLTGIVALVFHVFIMGIQKSELDKKINAAVSASEEACEADKQITNEVSNEYQTKIADLSKHIARIKRMRDNTCVQVADTTKGCDATSSGGQPVRKNGIDSETLFDFASEAERYRLQLIACQNYVNKIND